MICNQWYAILPAKEVKPGKLCAVKRLGLELVLFRDENGTLGCLRDRCSHRKAALSKGKITANHLACPFHGLQFNTQGECRLVPANGHQSNDLKRFNVQAYHVREAFGIIYFWYGEGEPDKKPPFFTDLLNPRFVYHEIKELWNTHYSRCIENQLDVVHLPFVPYNTIGRGNKTVVNGPKVISDDTFIQTGADNEVDLGQRPRETQDAKISNTFLNFLFPNVWMNRISEDMRVVIYFAPVDEEQTILYLRFYTKFTPYKLVNRAFARLGSIGDRIIERQDKRVVETQRPKASALVSGENLIPGDLPVAQYRRTRKALQDKCAHAPPGGKAAL